MGTISSGIGLISGLDYDSLISQLIAIEARPRDQLLSRIGEIDAQRTAYLDISARISALLTHVNKLAQRSFFTSSTVSSSNRDVLSVTAGSGAVPGSYSFVVKSLATTHQLVSRGFASRGTQLSPGLVTIESARARVNAQTRLDELNGYRGVHRASFEIIDGAGNTATIDLSDALTLADVVDKIEQAGVRVQAEVYNDHLILTETDGGTLRVRELGGGHAAADLGFGPGKTYDAGGRIEGSDLVYLDDATPLSALNDGNGVRRAKAGGDFTINGMSVDLSEILKSETRIERLNHGRGVELGRLRITTEDGAGKEHPFEIDLSGLSTIGQVKDALEGSLEGVSVTIADNRLIVAYNDREANDERLLKIEDLSGNAARDLGIRGESETGKINGSGILFVDTVGDVVNAIDFASGNEGDITASIDGTRLVISADGPVDLLATNGSAALFDLGFVEGTSDEAASGRRIIGGLDSALLSSLNGGQGFEPGRIHIQVGESGVTLDLSDVETLAGVIQRINEAGQAEELGIEVGYDHTGTRLVVSSIDGVTPVSISDVAGYGSFAADIGLAQDPPSAQLRSDNLQLRYINETNRLSELNNGRGVAAGKIEITNSLGLFATVDLSGGEVRTLQDVVSKINSATTASGDPLNVTARINDTGDGLVVEDAAGGSFGLKIEDQSGTAARDLNLLGDSDTGTIDGSYEINIALSGSETLDDLVDLINEQGGVATATVLNDGTGIAPYRLQVSSTATGSTGELIVDGLDFSTLSVAQDARVVLGSSASSGVLMTSSSNTLTDVVPGLTLDLTGVSDEAVTVTVERDVDSVVEALAAFFDGYNAALARIEEFSGYDAETEKRGVLLGEGALQMVDRRLARMIAQQPEGASGNIRRLSDIGVRVRNGEIEFDEEKFRAVFEEHREELIAFFTNEESGLAGLMKTQLESITESEGLIDRRQSTLEKQEDLLSDRVDTLNERLERKRERLLRDFLNMESALASLQAQQTALTQLASLASNYSLQSSQ